MTRRGTQFTALAVAALLLPGCAKNPFSLRDARDPIVDEGTYVTPVDPLIALDNLRFAVIEQNIGHYVQVFSDSMVYAFDFLLSDRPDSLSGWGYAEETRIARNLFSAAGNISLVWNPTPGRTDQLSDSSAVLYRSYTIDAVVMDADTLASLSCAGDLIVRVTRNSLDLWWVQEWEDFHQSAQRLSWADLKSRFR
jgi:hypothetical protein